MGKLRPDGVTSGAVLAYLQREADMDGLVTISSEEVGRAVGISQPAASYLLRRLADSGVISPQGFTKGVKGHAILAYQLADEVMA